MKNRVAVGGQQHISALRDFIDGDLLVLEEETYASLPKRETEKQP